MTKTVSTTDIRQRIGDILNRVALRHDEFVVQRKGKKLAAIVPIFRLEQMRRFARSHALAFLDERRDVALSDAEVAKLAAEARRYARKRTRKRSARAKHK